MNTSVLKTVKAHYTQKKSCSNAGRIIAIPPTDRYITCHIIYLKASICSLNVAKTEKSNHLNTIYQNQ